MTGEPRACAIISLLKRSLPSHIMGDTRASLASITLTGVVQQAAPRCIVEEVPHKRIPQQPAGRGVVHAGAAREVRAQIGGRQVCIQSCMEKGFQCQEGRCDCGPAGTASTALGACNPM